MNRILLIVIISLLNSVISSAESFSGIVVNENNEPLPYSTIRVKKKRIATLGSKDGLFKLTSDAICENDTIIISYIGYEPLNIRVGEYPDSDNCLKMRTQLTQLNEISIYAPQNIKRKTVSKGKKHSWSLLRTCICGKTAGDTYGYEFHSKNNKKLLLEKVGFFYCAGDRQMTGMNFRINVYDMSNVAGDPSSDFINVLDAPKFFEYKLDDNDNGRFEFILPEPIMLPEHAMVEIEFLENLDDEIFWFKSNLIGGKTWTKLFNENIWVKTPFSTPFFIECSEIED